MSWVRARRHTKRLTRVPPRYSQEPATFSEGIGRAWPAPAHPDRNVNTRFWCSRKFRSPFSFSVRAWPELHCTMVRSNFRGTVMQTTFNSIRFAICALLLFCSAFATAIFGQTLRPVTKFDLPGPGGKRFEYLTIDDDDHNAWAAARLSTRCLPKSSPGRQDAG